MSLQNDKLLHSEPKLLFQSPAGFYSIPFACNTLPALVEVDRPLCLLPRDDAIVAVGHDGLDGGVELGRPVERAALRGGAAVGVQRDGTQ